MRYPPTVLLFCTCNTVLQLQLLYICGSEICYSLLSNKLHIREPIMIFYGCIWNENLILEKNISGCQQFLLLYARPVGVLLFVFGSWQHTVKKLTNTENAKAPVDPWFLACPWTLVTAKQTWAAYLMRVPLSRQLTWWESSCHGLPWLLTSRIAPSHHGDHAKKSLARWARRFARKQNWIILKFWKWSFKIQTGTRSRLLININQTVPSNVKGATTAPWQHWVT